MISWSFSSCTRNAALGKSSVTVPGNSRSSSFAIMILGSAGLPPARRSGADPNRELCVCEPLEDEGMSDFEDLSAKAARLWLEFMQAQARGPPAAAQNLPDVTRSLAEAGVPLASEVNRWIEATLPPKSSEEASSDQA